jgi:hypothetical protein
VTLNVSGLGLVVRARSVGTAAGVQAPFSFTFLDP